MIANEDDAREFVARRCTDQAFLTLNDYVDELRAEAFEQNLVSRSSLDQVWTRHIADSAQLLDHVSHGTRSWADLGSGAGLPGLVIAIMRPDLKVSLIESRRKRFEWLQTVCVNLELRNCQVLGRRLETIEDRHFDVISARAFAPLQKLFALAGRLADESTFWILPKGKSAADELAQLPSEAQKGFHVEQSVSDQNAGILVGYHRALENRV
ncbi:16S rRNA (guanine(527)-N(7))-methyltransferase RsmG [Altererythrobacter sp. SALINAS58]|uniref:16S rRNA (guanine(527)-N(7))-methyltransferase RsmG n=1 Tax=Alteripontixanthobacter muriae TaxID=2705546 RepID=UPI001575A21D|nr:16S rRNA (guanine(527)-N(7))-methyltransferase RsmG [Alteripontixanthobacter muriae]NTZ43524.1 16S rRNA (guanine(527)-N(7))-methyltransferase RsmG [Alteripontixanthobacter muriae]